jgi:hypothetical protein
MIDPALTELVDRLRGPELRCRTGIVLLPPEQVGREEELAARLNIEPVDYVRVVEGDLLPGSRFLGVEAGTEEARLDRLAMATGARDCALVYNADLILSKLNQAARSGVWTFLRTSFPNRQRALVIALPAQATLVQPDGEEREGWVRSGLLVRPASPSPPGL